MLGVPESVLDLAALLMSDNRNAIIKVSAAIGFIVPSLQLWCLQYGMRRRSSSSLCCCATGPKLATGSVCPWLCSSDCDLTPTYVLCWCDCVHVRAVVLAMDALQTRGQEMLRRDRLLKLMQRDSSDWELKVRRLLYHVCHTCKHT